MRNLIRPLPFTAVSNMAIDSDLSDQALGMLVRWLRLPEGSEVEKVSDDDARYAAWCELEAAGHLVRSLEPDATGGCEWVVTVHDAPVQPGSDGAR